MFLFWQFLLRLHLLLLLLGHDVDQTCGEPDKDGGDGEEVDWGVEEDQAGQGDWQFVQGADHRVGGGGGDSDTPARAVGDTDGGCAGDDHGEPDADSRGWWEVQVQVCRRPVFQQKGGDQQDRDGQQVVVVHGVKVLEVGQLNSLSHEENEGGGREAVQGHPEVADVEVHGAACVGVTVGGDDGGENHEDEGAERHWGDLTAKPQDLAVGDQDDGQVLENGVDWDGQVLQGLRGGVDHED